VAVALLGQRHEQARASQTNQEEFVHESIRSSTRG
jgi:hypothetical protein